MRAFVLAITMLVHAPLAIAEGLSPSLRSQYYCHPEGDGKFIFANVATGYTRGDRGVSYFDSGVALIRFRASN